ncbi:MAG: hypothetical protein IPK92_14715 [Nitrospira sp.]|nr:hypothetical protein [Nitrospira sp.]
MDVELNANSTASKQTDSTPAQDEPPPALSLQSIDQTLSTSTLLGPNADATEEEETLTLLGNSDLRKISESLSSLLQPELKKGSVTVRQRGNKLTLALANSDLFSTGDATVTLGGTLLARTNRCRPARVQIPRDRGGRTYRQHPAQIRPPKGLPR